jgi:hypothetical protein
VFVSNEPVSDVTVVMSLNIGFALFDALPYTNEFPCVSSPKRTIIPAISGAAALVPPLYEIEGLLLPGCVIQTWTPVYGSPTDDMSVSMRFVHLDVIPLGSLPAWKLGAATYLLQPLPVPQSCWL